MSRKKRYIKNLTAEDIAKLEAGKKEGKSEVYRNRCHAILLSNKGYTVGQIMDIFSVSKTTVYNWFNRWDKNGFEELATKSGQGRKPALRTDNSEHVQGVEKAAKNAFESGRNILLEVQEELGLETPITQRMLSFFLRKLAGYGSDVVEG